MSYTRYEIPVQDDADVNEILSRCSAETLPRLSVQHKMTDVNEQKLDGKGEIVKGDLLGWKEDPTPSVLIGIFEGDVSFPDFIGRSMTKTLKM